MGGNSSTTSSYLEKLPRQDWKQQQSHNERKVFQNNKDSTLWIEEYHVGLDNEQLLKQIIEMYQLRKNDPQIVASYHLRVDPKQQLCSTSYRGELYLERIPITLSNITDIPFPDILHVHHQALNGLQRLSRWAGQFQVNEDCIGVNDRNVVKVWFHHQYDRPYPTNRKRSEQALVRSIVDLIEQNTDNRTLPTDISIHDYIYQHSPNVGFSQARRRIEEYANTYHRGAIPSRLRCAVNAGGAHNIKQHWRRNSLDNTEQRNSNPQVLSPVPHTYTSNDGMGKSAMNLMQSPGEEVGQNKADSVQTPNFTIRAQQQIPNNVQPAREVRELSEENSKIGRKQEGMRKQNLSAPSTHRFRPPMPVIKQEVVQQSLQQSQPIYPFNQPPLQQPLQQSPLQQPSQQSTQQLQINKTQANTQVRPSIKIPPPTQKQLPPKQQPPQIQLPPQPKQERVQNGAIQVQMKPIVRIQPTQVQSVQQTPRQGPGQVVQGSNRGVIQNNIAHHQVEKRQPIPSRVHQSQLPPNQAPLPNWMAAKPISVPLNPQIPPPMEHPQVITREQTSMAVPKKQQNRIYRLEYEKSPLISHTDSPQRLATQSHSVQGNEIKVSQVGNQSMSSIGVSNVPSRTNKQYSEKMFSQIKEESIHNSTRNFYNKYMGQDESNLEWQTEIQQRSQLTDDMNRQGSENFTQVGRKNQEANGIGYSFGHEGTSSEVLAKLRDNQPVEYKYEPTTYQYSNTEKYYQAEPDYRGEYNPSYEVQQPKEQQSNQYQYYEGKQYAFENSPALDKQPNEYQYRQQSYQYKPESYGQQDYQYGSQQEYVRQEKPITQLDNLEMKYSVMEEKAKEEEKYNVEWDPQILADIQANIHEK